MAARPFFRQHCNSPSQAAGSLGLRTEPSDGVNGNTRRFTATISRIIGQSNRLADIHAFWPALGSPQSVSLPPQSLGLLPNRQDVIAECREHLLARQAVERRR